MERRKLFTSQTPRKKLFSSEPEERKIKLFSADSEELGFQRVFSETTDPLELKLKEFSGRTLGMEEYTSEFGGEDLISRGFAETCGEDSVKINDDAFMQARLFSMITMSVTKTLSLDRDIMCGGVSKEEVISGLGDRGLSPKCIMLIKKAHNIPVEEDENNWISDSGISQDLSSEFGGSEKPLPEFKKIINTRYNDAPSDILDILKNRGIIQVDGEVVKIIK